MKRVLVILIALNLTASGSPADIHATQSSSVGKTSTPSASYSATELEPPDAGDRLMETATPSGSQRSVDRGIAVIAIADLAARLGIDKAKIEVISVEEVTWRDGSLGCPQPGHVYTQALVNGSRIILQAEGRTWHYHSGGGRDPFLCMTPQEPLTRGDDAGGDYGDY